MALFNSRKVDVATGCWFLMPLLRPDQPLIKGINCLNFPQLLQSPLFGRKISFFPLNAGLS